MAEQLGHPDDVTDDEAKDIEAGLLVDYGIDVMEARKLIEDVRADGGIDRFLRERAREQELTALHRVEDPEGTGPVDPSAPPREASPDLERFLQEREEESS